MSKEFNDIQEPEYFSEHQKALDEQEEYESILKNDSGYQDFLNRLEENRLNQ